MIQSATAACCACCHAAQDGMLPSRTVGNISITEKNPPLKTNFSDQLYTQHKQIQTKCRKYFAAHPRTCSKMQGSAGVWGSKDPVDRK